MNGSLGRIGVMVSFSKIFFWVSSFIVVAAAVCAVNGWLLMLAVGILAGSNVVNGTLNFWDSVLVWLLLASVFASFRLGKSSSSS